MDEQIVVLHKHIENCMYDIKTIIDLDEESARKALILENTPKHEINFHIQALGEFVVSLRKLVGVGSVQTPHNNFYELKHDSDLLRKEINYILSQVDELQQMTRETEMIIEELKKENAELLSQINSI